MKNYNVVKKQFTRTFCDEVYEIVSQVPIGKVSTYGEIALLLGAPQCSRMVGRALKHVPLGLNIPCHRIVNSAGRLVPGWELQQKLLLSEGVSLKSNGCVDLNRYLWKY